jgi:transposase
VNRRARKPARPPRSKTVKAPKPLKKGSKIDPEGYDAGKKVTGRKRHILVDTLGLLLNLIVLPAEIQDRHAARDFLKQTRSRFPFVERIYADGGYSGTKTAAMVRSTGCWKIEILKRSDAHRFVVLPKRWTVERTFAWISRNRRLTRDFERYASTAVVFVRLAIIRLMLKRLTRRATVHE